MNKAIWILVGIGSLLGIWWVFKTTSTPRTGNASSIAAANGENGVINYGLSGALPSWRFGNGPDSLALPDSGLAYSTATGKWTNSVGTPLPTSSRYVN